MRWNYDRETYEQKYERIAESIKAAEGDEIVLVGESAGGAMALFAFSRQLDHVSRVVTICGYNHGAADVHPYHKRAHPAFYQMMPLVDGIVDSLALENRQCIRTIYSSRDRLVTPQHSRIDGAKEKILNTPVHFFAITRVLLGRAPLPND